MTTVPLFTPPRPVPSTGELGLLRLLTAVRTNALSMWPEEAYERDILVQRFLGRQRMLLNSPTAIHRVLIDNPGNYRRSRATIRILRPIVGDGLFLSEGEEWKHQRRTIAPTLAPRVLPMLTQHVVDCAAEAIDTLAAAGGGPVDLLSAMQFLALEIAGRSMFSVEMQAHGAALRQMIGEFAEDLGRPFLFDMLMPSGVPTFRDFRRRRFRARWTTLMDRIVAERLKAAPASEARDLFDVLVAARDPETGGRFSPAQLRDQVATLIVAGHETTALTLFWALYLLASAPAEQQKLALEVRGIDLGPAAAAQAMAKLPFTRAVVNETLRLYPPAFVMVRETIAADRVDDTEIVPGTLVMIAPWVLHRHRKLWRDPNAFDPSRFLEEATDRDRLAYLPFGAGPRVCVGAQFALTEATLVLAALVQHFEIALGDRLPVYPEAVVTTQPSRAAAFRLTPRRPLTSPAAT